ncbi:MAG: universal stress protein [Candidatus Obscuribacterales bacterium]|nr:universal stress protein [Candidatus Obscuribacterales bacterium]
MKVLVAIDGTDCSKEALDFVAQRRWDQKDEFLVVCVAEPLTESFDQCDFDQEFSLEEMVEDCKQLTERGASRLRNCLSENKIATSVITGLPVEKIVDKAFDWDADLIILGSHGRSGCRRFMVGSVAEQVLKQASCTVEVVRVRPHG